MIKTLVTIGPKTAEKASIKQFLPFTDLFRLNGSHSTVEWHSNAIDTIRGECSDAFILMDIPGSKPRTSNKRDIKICKGQKVCFGESDQFPELLNIGLTKKLPKYRASIQQFSLNDGQFLFDVTASGHGFIVGECRDNFVLNPKKGINLPGSVYDEDEQLLVYKSFINQIDVLEIDALGLSFVQTPDLVNSIKAIRPDVVLIAKIENSEGLKNCSDIAASADAIMIDRGDLVAEIGYENLFAGIETIAQATKSHGKPLIMATENLESMLGRELPSKSEVVSLAHSASIGVDCFMLSEETAISDNAFVIVNWLHNFSKKLAPKKEQLHSDTNLIGYKSDIWRSIACYPDLNVFVMSKSGRALTRYLSVHPDLDFFLLTDSSKVKNWCRLYSNSINTHIGDLDKKQNLDLIMKTINKHKKTIFSRDDKVLAVYVSEYTNTPRANTITIFHKEDFY